MRNAIITATLAAFWPLLAQAGLVTQGDQASHIMAGGFCIEKPDSARPAPGVMTGQVFKSKHAYNIVVMGDHVPAETNLAIGLIFQMAEHRPDEQILMQMASLDDGRPPNVWMHTVGADGKNWFSRQPPRGSTLTPGRYRFSAFRADQVLVVYEFTVIPSQNNGDTAGPCAPALS